MSYKKRVLHMIGNAHIDPVWLWRWQEGFHEVKATFRSALDRLAEYDDFVFISSSAAFYEWVEKSDPQMFEEIRERIAEGRWEVVGGWWIQPDCNIPGGESYARQALYGQRYFYEKFGVTARVGYNVDSFGHNGMLPQLLKQSGLDYYVFMRPQPHEKGLPGWLFWWESDDGSRVLTQRIPFEYCTWGKELDKHVQRCAAEVKPPVNHLMCFYGVGNHGGGPTRENIESIQRMHEDSLSAGDQPQLQFSTPNRFFAATEAAESHERSIPVVHDELQRHASGCYSAHSGIKRWNREAEHRLLNAEAWSAVASRVTGQPYPDEAWDRAWKNVLFNQFHDILAGTSLPSAYDDALQMHGEAMAIADRALNYAVQSLAWNVRIEQDEEMTPILVFNPHAWDSRVNVELEYGKLPEKPLLLDDQDREVPLQLVQSETTANGRHRLSFIADLPSLGYRTYRLTSGEYSDELTQVEASDTVLDNGRLRLEINPETGEIASLRDLEHGVELFESPAARAVVLEDTSDTWSHNVFRFDQEVGSFRATDVHLVEHGPVKSVIRVRSAFGNSTLVQDFTMYPQLDQEASLPIDVHVTVDWAEQFRALKLRFPMNLTHMRAVSEIPYGSIERFANGEEEPGQRWLDLSGMARDSGERLVDGRYGLSLLNDGKYSYDVNIRDIGLTVLRSPVYAHHIPAQPQADNHYRFIDQGLQRFTYSLLPHTGTWQDAGTVRRAAELNERPTALVGTYHPQGTLPQSDSYVQVDQPNVNVTVLKQAEGPKTGGPTTGEGDDLILRCYETARAVTEATITLPHWNRFIEAHFGPSEIKTFRIPHDQSRPVVETNLIELEELPEQDLPGKENGHGVQARTRASDAETA